MKKYLREYRSYLEEKNVFPYEVIVVDMALLERPLPVFGKQRQLQSYLDKNGIVYEKVFHYSANRLSFYVSELDTDKFTQLMYLTFGLDKMLEVVGAVMMDKIKMGISHRMFMYRTGTYTKDQLLSTNPGRLLVTGTGGEFLEGEDYFRKLWEETSVKHPNPAAFMPAWPLEGQYHTLPEGEHFGAITLGNIIN